MSLQIEHGSTKQRKEECPFHVLEREGSKALMWQELCGSGQAVDLGGRRQEIMPARQAVLVRPLGLSW